MWYRSFLRNVTVNFSVLKKKYQTCALQYFLILMSNKLKILITNGLKTLAV